MEREVYYRVEDGYLTEGGWTAPQIREFRVLRKTRCGVWLSDGWRERFVLNKARKRLAYPTEKEAIDSYRCRKIREIGFAQARITKAEYMITCAEENRIRNRPYVTLSPAA